MTGLFDPLELGAIELPNRIVMAPLTRARAGREAVPNALMAAYYAQRASAGLIISEATGISREGLGWPNAPGLWNDAQVEGWKRVTDAVHHPAGGSSPSCGTWAGWSIPTSAAASRSASSATTAPDFAHTYEGKKPYVEARAATRDDIRRIIGDYATAARNAIAPASTASRSTAPTAIWSTNSCATAPTSATTNMADRSTTGCAS